MEDISIGSFTSEFIKDLFWPDWRDFHQKNEKWSIGIEFTNRRIFYKTEYSVLSNISKTRIFL
jgi:hypothetical protein